MHGQSQRISSTDQSAQLKNLHFNFSSSETAWRQARAVSCNLLAKLIQNLNICPTTLSAFVKTTRQFGERDIRGFSFPEAEHYNFFFSAVQYC